MPRISAKRIAIAAICLLLPVAVLALPWRRPESVEPTSSTPPRTVPSVTRPLAGSRYPWTLGEARTALKRQPDDLYLQYIVLQLARHEDRLAEVMSDIPRFADRDTADPNDAFAVFAISGRQQERLQLEALLPPRGEPNSNSSARSIPIAQLQAPAIPEPAWGRLHGDKTPAVSALAKWVPADFYIAEFRSVDRLAHALDIAGTWLAFLNVQLAQHGTHVPMRRRLEEQLVFTANDKALQPLIGQVAIVGSDLTLAEGSDVTLLFTLKPDTMEPFRVRAERALANAAAQPGAGRTDGKYLGVDYTYVATADQRIGAYAATLPTQRLHIRSNSRAAFHRILDTVVGPSSPSLATVAEHQHIRAKFPLGANEEDGLIHVPRGLLREVLGPARQITESRRRVAATHLRMIGHAAQLYRTQFGKSPTSLDELARAGCTPGQFNQRPLTSPFGGTYGLSSDGITGVCSVAGSLERLVPCIDLVSAVTTATPHEAEAYRAVARAITPMSRLLLMPTALRLHTSPSRVRVEALVLTPAGHPVSAGLARWTGGNAEPLDPLPVSRRSIVSLSLRMNKERLLADSANTQPSGAVMSGSQLALLVATAPPAGGPFPAILPAAQAAAPSATRTQAPGLDFVRRLGLEMPHLRTLIERGIGNQASLHLCDAASVVDLSLPTGIREMATTAQDSTLGTWDTLYGLGFGIGTLAGPAYVAFPVLEPRVVDEFLTQLDASLARQPVTWRDPRFGTHVQARSYRLASPSGTDLHGLSIQVGPARYRLFWARIGEGLYLANQPTLLDDLQTAHTQRSPLGTSDKGPTGHAMVKVRGDQWSQAIPSFLFGCEEANCAACQRNLASLSAAARAFSYTPPVLGIALDHETRQRLVLQYAVRLYGRDFTCPDAGTYTLAADGKSFTCSVHGSVDRPAQTDRPAAGPGAQHLSDATAVLTITPAGLRVILTVSQR
jgi:hypothetical protein